MIRTILRLGVPLVFVVVPGAFAYAGCGGDNFAVDNTDGSVTCDEAGVCTSNSGEGGGGGPGGGGPGGGGSCKAAGAACAAGPECCTFACTGGTCAATQCTADNQQCTSNAQCCGGSCATGDAGAQTCKPLNATCKTSGNPCAANADCCSKLCTSGICDGKPSFCTQDGDTCTADSDCCGASCTKAAGASLGVCGVTAAPGTPDCTPAGQVCAAATTGGDGGVNCGGDCCSRSCRPYAPTGALICQPPSGCRPTGELCLVDNDCCGAPGAPGSTDSSGGGKSTNVHCAKAAGATIGRCDNGNACSPAGAICRLAANSCNATDRCCAGTVQTHPLNCKQDALGIPRCTAESDYDCTAKGPPPPGTACATSADCCNNPCVPNPSGSPPFVCGAQKCVATGGQCTTTADCCDGSPCVLPTGGSTGTCGPAGTGGGGGGGGSDSGSTGGGGTNCAQVGQICTVTSDCCAGIGLTCLGGRCGVLR